MRRHLSSLRRLGLHATTAGDFFLRRRSGLSPSAQAMYVAVQASHRPNALCVFVVPTDEEVDRLAGDTRFFMAALEGASAAALGDAVKTLPSLQMDPYRNLAPHFGVASTRAAALHGIATGTARVVVASAAARSKVAVSMRTSLSSAMLRMQPITQRSISYLS